MLVVLIIFICFVHAKTTVKNADFGPLNGTFQDFNPIRRFLSGQIPYKDFSDYLGLGHLYLGTFVTILFGKTYTASKTAFVFLPLFSLSLISLVLGTAITNSFTKALAATGLILSFLLIKPLFFTNNVTFSEEIQKAFDYALKNGNSARMVRCFILPLACILLILSFSYYSKHKEKLSKFLCFLCFSIFSGFTLPWSNDYGISTYICLIILFYVVVISRTRSIWKALLLTASDVVLSMIGIAVSVEIFTLGNFPNWLHTTFGIGGYQSWYPNTEKHFYIFNIDLTWSSMLQLLLCIFYCIKIFRAKASAASVTRYGIPFLCNLTCFCAMNEYYMISGDSARECGLIILTLTVLFESSAFILSLFSSHADRFSQTMEIVSLLCMISWSVPALYNNLLLEGLYPKEGTYIPQMGGHVTELGSSLVKTKAFLGDEKIFSTYASAMELVTDQFQPTGTDYIIHVLGDANREKYLDDFKTGDFRYTSTIKEAFSPWEYYIRRSNWYFYRELYRSWHPVYANQYQLFWERNDEGQEYLISTDDTDIGVFIEQEESTKAKIIVKTSQNVTGFADVKIDYSVNKNASNTAKLMFQRMLYVSEDANEMSELPWYGTNYLRDHNTEYIPVTIVDGYGEIDLSGVPKENTNLIINNAECNEIFTVPFNFVDIIDLGYEKDIPCFRIYRNRQNITALTGKTQLTLGDFTIPIKGLSNDDNYLLVLLDLDDISFNDLEKYLNLQTVAEVRVQD